MGNVSIGLWVLQALFGLMKITTSQADILAMGDQMVWAGRVPAGLIGISELTGGLLASRAPDRRGRHPASRGRPQSER